MSVHGVGLILEILEMLYGDGRSDPISEFYAFGVYLIGWGFQNVKQPSKMPILLQWDRTSPERGKPPRIWLGCMERFFYVTAFMAIILRADDSVNVEATVFPFSFLANH